MLGSEILCFLDGWMVTWGQLLLLERERSLLVLLTCSDLAELESSQEISAAVAEFRTMSRV